MGASVCVDASVVLPLMTAPPGNPAHALWDEWELNSTRLLAPLLLRYECASVLYRYRRQGHLSAEACDAALGGILALPVITVVDPHLHQSAMAVAARYDLPAAYDAHYVALAERESAQFCTADLRLARRLRECGAEWVLVPGE